MKTQTFSSIHGCRKQHVKSGHVQGKKVPLLFRKKNRNVSTGEGAVQTLVYVRGELRKNDCMKLIFVDESLNRRGEISLGGVCVSPGHHQWRNKRQKTEQEFGHVGGTQVWDETRSLHGRWNTEENRGTFGGAQVSQAQVSPHG